jgi:hypothetical protein
MHGQSDTYLRPTQYEYLCIKEWIIALTWTELPIVAFLAAPVAGHAECAAVLAVRSFMHGNKSCYSSTFPAAFQIVQGVEVAYGDGCLQ